MNTLFHSTSKVKDARSRIGAKGASLHQMMKLGLAVPPWFAVSTNAVERIRAEGFSPEEKELIRASLAKLHFPVSVRSSGTVSMPGMMDTQLNVKSFEGVLEYILAVAESYNSTRAVLYRETKGIGTVPMGIIIQQMVDGKLPVPGSGSGIMTTRNIDTGEDEIVVEFAPHQSGDGIVNGSVTPRDTEWVKKLQPTLYASLALAATKLEMFYGDVQDVEFTVEKDKVWFLQTRSAKRSPKASVRIAYEMYSQGIINSTKALALADPHYLENGERMTELKLEKGAKKIAKGLKVTGGKVVGQMFSVEDWPENPSEDVVLFAHQTTPSHLPAMLKSKGIVTMVGGQLSHAALVAREFKIPALVGIGSFNGEMHPSQIVGKVISLDADSGFLWSGKAEIVESVTKDSYREKLLEVKNSV